MFSPLYGCARCCDAALIDRCTFFVSLSTFSLASFARLSYASSRTRGRSSEMRGKTPSPYKLTFSGWKCATWTRKLLLNFSGTAGMKRTRSDFCSPGSMKPCRQQNNTSSTVLSPRQLSSDVTIESNLVWNHDWNSGLRPHSHGRIHSKTAKVETNATRVHQSDFRFRHVVVQLQGKNINII